MKDIRDYIHLYFGQKFQYKGNIYTITRIDDLVRGSRISDAGFEKWNEFTPEKCKLILRHLSDMTEQEMIGLLQSMVPEDMEDKPDTDEYDLQMFYNDGGNMVDANVIVGAEYSCRCYEGQITIKKCGTICAYDYEGNEQELVNAPKAYYFLLKQGFELFGLIDAGLALDSKQINKEQ